MLWEAIALVAVVVACVACGALLVTFRAYDVARAELDGYERRASRAAAQVTLP